MNDNDNDILSIIIDTYLSNQFALSKAQIVIHILGIDGDFELFVAQEIGDTVHYKGF